MTLQSMDTAPKDGTSILAWCDHEADPVVEDEAKGTLTLYAAHYEGLSHAPTGWHIVTWGGAWDDSTHEYSGGSLPDWWFVAGTNFEVAANPVAWTPLPPPPKEGE
jgi:hypothetical protein